MRNGILAALVAAVLVACTPAKAEAWGFAAHRLIMERAIDLLPPGLKPFFNRFRSDVVAHVTDPDLWRNVGWDDDANHFIDFGVREYGAYPFNRLPRDYGAAVEKFGTATLKRYGLLPWREVEEFGNLRRAFEDFRREAPYTTTDAMLFSAVAAHYLQDAYQPLHATDNYDGQQTGQGGLHARFERDLVERYQTRIRLTPAPPQPIANIRDTTFDAVLKSYTLVAPMLAADKEALGNREAYDDAYFDALFGRLQPMLEAQLSGAITATASMIVGAWRQAGRPPIRTTDPRPTQRVRPPR